MSGVTAVVSVCIVGLCACVGYLLYVGFVALRKRLGKEKEVFELSDDVLEIDLREYKRNKKK